MYVPKLRTQRLVAYENVASANTAEPSSARCVVKREGCAQQAVPQLTHSALAAGEWLRARPPTAVTCCVLCSDVMGWEGGASCRLGVRKWGCVVGAFVCTRQVGPRGIRTRDPGPEWVEGRDSANGAASAPAAAYMAAHAARPAAWCEGIAAMFVAPWRGSRQGPTWSASAWANRTPEENLLIQDTDAMRDKPFLSLLSSLFWISRCCRYDIAVALTILSRASSNAEPKHWTALDGS